MCSVRPGEVVEPFPLVQLRLQVDIPFIAEELIKFLLIRSVGSLNFTIELWCAPLDVGVSNALVLDMPMELGLELIAIVSSDFLDEDITYNSSMVIIPRTSFV